MNVAMMNWTKPIAVMDRLIHAAFKLKRQWKRMMRVHKLRVRIADGARFPPIPHQILELPPRLDDPLAATGA